jgi:hypothetical protein
MSNRRGSNHRTGWHLLPSEAVESPAAVRRRARETDAARRARRWDHARWIAINLVLIGVSAWLYVHVLIPRFITKEPASQAAAFVHAAQENSAPSATPAARPEYVRVGATPRHLPDHRRPRPEPRSTPKPVYATPAIIKELGARCVGGRVFRTTVTNGVTAIDEVAGLHC